jgi:hypothetical protein
MKDEDDYENKINDLNQIYLFLINRIYLKIQRRNDFGKIKEKEVEKIKDNKDNKNINKTNNNNNNLFFF